MKEHVLYQGGQVFLDYLLLLSDVARGPLVNHEHIYIFSCLKQNKIPGPVFLDFIIFLQIRYEIEKSAQFTY